MSINKIGDYEILDKLPPQGAGILYKGKIGDREVLIKVIPPELAKDEEFKERFLRQMEVVSRLDHPNIIQSFDFGLDVSTGAYYIVYEFLKGETLEQGLVRLEKFPYPMAIRIARQVAKGLQHAHEKGIIHRNINPQNIFLGEDGSVKITNFGLAKFVKKSSITSAGTVLGTPLYIAPEQARSESTVDIRADIYSLGITLFHLLAGRPPFNDRIPMKVLNAHFNEPLPPLRDFTSDFPEGLEKVLDKMTAKEPEERYSTPQEVAKVLKDLVT